MSLYGRPMQRLKIPVTSLESTEVQGLFQAGFLSSVVGFGLARFSDMGLLLASHSTPYLALLLLQPPQLYSTEVQG